MVGFKSFVARLIFAVFFLASLPSPTNGSVDTGRLRPLPWMRPEYIVAVEGVVYCKCQLPGYLESLNASPLPGAVAKLLCYNGKQRVSTRGITDVRGYFLIRTTNVSSSMIPTCRLFLVKSPLPGCDVPAPGKWRGFPLRFERNITVGSTQQALYTAGLFKVGPATAASCPHHP
ncbi:non-classical arabinogalactan protein 31-like [Elaeis guineensis]|uniref:non-classical arabinogalactan protein 31-like n=1 Tax=Elaeis guineensis var. tenera TaxID=51953 RepID=UPI003C6D960A